MANFTHRFTGRVENYIKYRPSYPEEVLGILKTDVGLSSDQLIADIGSGTGILSKILLDAGYRVWGIEPNQEMREAAERLMAGNPRFTSIAAAAEDTTLSDQSVDLITVGQAFHWFDPVRSRTEFNRILKPNGSAVLIWNDAKEGSKFWHDYESFLLEHGTDYKELKEKGIEDDQRIHEFFSGNFSLKKLRNHQEFDLEGFTGRFLSISHAPMPNHAGYGPALQALRELFYRHQKDGQLRMEYDTKVYIGRPSGLA